MYVRSNGGNALGFGGLGSPDMNMYDRQGESQKKGLPYIDTIDNNGRSSLILSSHQG
jgi:hypothetical protein